MEINPLSLSDSKYEDRKNEELRNLYSWVLEDIRFQKNLQMTYVYYTIALYSAIIFLLSFFPSEAKNGSQLRVGLTILSAFIFIIGVWFMYATQQDINKSRMRIRRLYPFFTKEFNDVLEGEKFGLKTRKLSKFTFLVFILILVIGEGIVLFIIWFV